MAHISMSPTPWRVRSRNHAARLYAVAVAGGNPHAIAATSGRLAFHNGMVPQCGAADPAGVAWHREADVAGYRNRHARRRGSR